MGRRTWDSIPARFRPLPGRRNIVVTRNGRWYGDGAERVGSLEEAVALAGDVPEVFVIGGADLYGAALPFADELLLTEIDAEFAGDTVFPEVDPAVFEEVEREPHVSGNGMPFAFVRYVRRVLP
jgi:dihydrofolate reductase